MLPFKPNFSGGSRGFGETSAGGTPAGEALESSGKLHPTGMADKRWQEGLSSHIKGWAMKGNEY